MKKVLFIAYYWPPSGGAGVQRALKFVKFLPEFGIQPIVLTVSEKFASYPIIDESLSKELSKDVTVIKTKSIEALKLLSFFTTKKNIPHGGFSNSNKEKPLQKFLRYLRGNLFIPDARIGWIRFAEKAAAEIITKEKIDTIFITSPPHSSQLIGLRLKKKFSIRWIADLRDPWTDIYYYKDLLHTKRSADKDAAFELNVLQNADDVISVSMPIQTMFLNKDLSIPANKFHIIPNGFDENDFIDNVFPSKEYFYITYVGSLADSYNPDVFFATFKKIVAEFPNINFRMRFVGSMPASIKKIIDTNNLESITEFVSHVSHDAAIKYMQQSTALLLLIPDVPNNEGILTGKLFEYLASRRPVIGIGPVAGDAAAILAECEAGKMFGRNETGELGSYFKSLILQWLDKRELINTNDIYLRYSRRSLAKNLSSIILKEI